MRLVEFSVAADHVNEIGRSRPAAAVRTTVALVTDTVLGHAMLRVIASIRDNTVRRVGTFRSTEDAAEWLELPDADRALRGDIDTALTEGLGPEPGQRDSYARVLTEIADTATRV